MRLSSDDWYMTEKFGRKTMTLLVKDLTVAEKLYKLLGNDLDVEIEKHREARSLDANAYFHVLCRKLSEKLGSSEDEIKKEMVLKYGSIGRGQDGRYAGVMIPKGQDIEAIYPYARWIGETETCDQYLLLKQTHTLDTKEMSRLIDGTVSDCKAQDIEVMPPEDLKAILGRWGEK